MFDPERYSNKQFPASKLRTLPVSTHHLLPCMVHVHGHALFSNKKPKLHTAESTEGINDH